ncbi:MULTISPECIES: restriction endonuclease subunit S [unclassified Nocardioides]|uniref:restriction endonuclease subunit S n=1 Tax=unclassified Nocardioides TaxID=2615069 RepID=UPI0030143A0B
MNVATLGEVTDLITDGTHASPLRTPTGVPVLSAQNVKGGRLLTQTNRFTSEAELSAFEKRVTPQKGDVLLTIVGTIGRAAILDERPSAVFQRSVAVIRPSATRLDGRYLLHVTQSRDFQEQMRRSTNQSSQAGIYLAKLRALTLPLPPLDQQRRIAAILDQADALRAKRRQCLAHLDSLTRSIASEALSPVLAESSDAVLGDIADVLTGFAFPSARFVAEGVRLCRGANVLPGRLDWSDLRCWSSDEVRGLDRFALSEGDIVLALDRPWITEGQKMARVSKVDLPSLLVQRVARIRASSEEFQGLIWAALSSPSFQRHCRPTETTIPHISPVELRNYPIHVPSPPALSRLHATTSALETQRSAATRELAEMEELFASLQSRAFKGEL